MFVTCLIFPISARNVEETFASFFVFLPLAVFTLSSETGLDSKNACVFYKRSSLSNISFWILKLFVLPAVAHLLGTELVEEKPSEIRMVYILSSAW